MTRIRSGLVLACLAAGLAVGAWIQGDGGGAFLRGAAPVIESIGGVWLNALRMTVGPLVFALLVPQEQVDHHLQLLAALAGLFGHEEVRRRLREAGTVEAAAAVLLADSDSWGTA